MLAAQIRDAEPAGDSVVHLTFAGLPHAVGSLLGFGTQIEVLGPPSVRAALVDAAASVIELYRS